jgi:hypothetical protein
VSDHGLDGAVPLKRDCDTRCGACGIRPGALRAVAAAKRDGDERHNATMALALCARCATSRECRLGRPTATAGPKSLSAAGNKKSWGGGPWPPDFVPHRIPT